MLLIHTLHLVSVAHRTRQLESWLADTLAAFRNRHERQLAFIPHLVRGMKMAEFGDKYDGDIQSALRGLLKERLALDVAPIDRNAMKRKWAPAPEDENETRAEDSGNHSRAAKNREWFLSSISPNDVCDQKQPKPALRHHLLRRSQLSLEAALPLALTYLRHRALYVVFLLLIPGQFRSCRPQVTCPANLHSANAKPA